jgi:hypothetical protein
LCTSPSLLVLLGYLTIAAPYVPALGLPAALSGIRQTDDHSSVAVIARGIGLIAALRRSTLVTVAAVAVLLIAAVDLAGRGHIRRHPRRSSPGA